jgi:hypothetical protein
MDTPAFANFQPLLNVLAPHVASGRWIDVFNQAESACPRLRADESTLSALDYERAVFQDNAIPSRKTSWHDCFNALVWSRFPQTKRTLNSRHLAEGMAVSGNRRSRLRDGLTLLDEAGIIVSSTDGLLREMLHAHAWRELFIENRERWTASTHVVVFGHGLLESLAARPHLGLTGKVLWISEHVSLSGLDARVNAVVAAADDSLASQLSPLPVFGLPEWHADNGRADFYSNTKVFRPLSTMR